MQLEREGAWNKIQSNKTIKRTRALVSRYAGLTPKGSWAVAKPPPLLRCHHHLHLPVWLRDSLSAALGWKILEERSSPPRFSGTMLGIKSQDGQEHGLHNMALLQILTFVRASISIWKIMTTLFVSTFTPQPVLPGRRCTDQITNHIADLPASCLTLVPGPAVVIIVGFGFSLSQITGIHLLAIWTRDHFSNRHVWYFSALALSSTKIITKKKNPNLSFWKVAFSRVRQPSALNNWWLPPGEGLFREPGRLGLDPWWWPKIR